MLLARVRKLDVAMARVRHSVFDAKEACSNWEVVVTMISSPWTFWVFVVTAVNCCCSCCCFSISAACWRCMEGAEISIPRIMSRISEEVSEDTLTLFFLP